MINVGLFHKEETILPSKDKPEHVNWIQNKVCNVTFFVDEFAYKYAEEQFDGQDKIALFTEPVYPEIPQVIEENYDCVFIPNFGLAKDTTNAIYYPRGGSSFSASQIERQVRKKDIFSTEDSYENIAGSMFSVIDEGDTRLGYFTNKLVDCLLASTIPVYRGTVSVLEFFDPRSIVRWNTKDELDYVKQMLNNRFFMSRIKSVVYNQQAAWGFMFPEDYIFKNHRYIFENCEEKK